MGTELEQLAAIKVVTDCDTELYSCGEVCATVCDAELRRFLRLYRFRGLTVFNSAVARLLVQADKIYREEQDKFNDGSATPGAALAEGPS